MPLSPQTPYGEYLDQKEYNSKLEEINQCASREKISSYCFRKAQELRLEAAKLEDLGKILDILPNQIENVLYPIIHDYIYKRS